MTRIRIAPDGTVRGLWTDEMDWLSLGKAAVKRASHVEFSERRQLWYVRDGQARKALRAFLETLIRRHFGRVLHWSESRTGALAWEHDYFSPGGPGWPPSETSRGQVCAGAVAPRKEDNRLMELLRSIFSLFSGGRGGWHWVSDHRRSQAFGPRWSRHRVRHIDSYRRRRPRGPNRRTSKRRSST